MADDVPGAVVLEEREWIERSLLLRVSRDRPVGELDGPLLRDRSFELSEPACQLGRVLRIEHLDPESGVGWGLGEAGTAECEVLQRQPERLGIGELPFQQVKGGL